ncbi:MAG: hypothetical protein KC503_40080 [Myxococcales bacterium]|nr:hypothetical protein [Myxococcales bacterium]
MVRTVVAVSSLLLFASPGARAQTAPQQQVPKLVSTLTLSYDLGAGARRITLTDQIPHTFAIAGHTLLLSKGTLYAGLYKRVKGKLQPGRSMILAAPRTGASAISKIERLVAWDKASKPLRALQRQTAKRLRRAVAELARALGKKSDSETSRRKRLARYLGRHPTAPTELKRLRARLRLARAVLDTDSDIDNLIRVAPLATSPTSARKVYRDMNASANYTLMVLNTRGSDGWLQVNVAAQVRRALVYGYIAHACYELLDQIGTTYSPTRVRKRIFARAGLAASDALSAASFVRELVKHQPKARSLAHAARAALADQTPRRMKITVVSRTVRPNPAFAIARTQSGSRTLPLRVGKRLTTLGALLGARTLVLAAPCNAILPAWRKRLATLAVKNARAGLRVGIISTFRCSAVARQRGLWLGGPGHTLALGLSRTALAVLDNTGRVLWKQTLPTHTKGHAKGDIAATALRFLRRTWPPIVAQQRVSVRRAKSATFARLRRLLATARAHMRAQRYASATTKLAALLRSAPDFDPARRLLALALASQHRVIEALGVVRRWRRKFGALAGEDLMAGVRKRVERQREPPRPPHASR